MLLGRVFLVAISLMHKPKSPACICRVSLDYTGERGGYHLVFLVISGKQICIITIF